MALLNLFAAFAAVHVATAQSSCPQSFNGRIPQNATPALFDTNQSPFNPKYVLGQNLTWDQIVEFPDVPSSRFDQENGTKAVALKITDASIFASSSEGAESALRRAELLVNNNNATVSGHKTWHISVRTDPTRPLNYSHEYVLAFHEAQNFQADFWSLKAGASLDNATERKTIRVEGYKWDVPIKTFFEADLKDGVWYNFGIELNFPNNSIAIHYSTDDSPLTLVVPPTYNNISGIPPTTLGETHFGIQKRPVGANITSFLYNGVQEEGINEAMFFGGIFQDDSSNACVTN